ncbi:MAG: ATP-binding protein [Acidimicrobiia bacterium]
MTVGLDSIDQRARPRALMSWSSGKDSAWALHTVRQRGDLDVVALLTTFNSEFDRVSMQGVRRDLVDAQAQRVGLPVWPVELPWPCPNDEYERRMAMVIDRARDAGITRVVFGDLFLEDVRAYRTERLVGTGIEPVFPIWCGPEGTHTLAGQMINAGVRAVITALDPRQLDPSFAGRTFNADLLKDLPAGVDPLGENGEFHTFCYASPIFDRPIDCTLGDIVDRDGFVYADLLAR